MCKQVYKNVYVFEQQKKQIIWDLSLMKVFYWKLQKNVRIKRSNGFLCVHMNIKEYIFSSDVWCFFYLKNKNKRE